MFCLLQFLVLSTRCPTKEWIGRGQESSIAGEVGIPDRRTTITGGREEKGRSDLGEKADESAETSRELLHCCCWAGRVSPCCCSLICHLSPAPQCTTLHGESPPSRLPTMTSNVACHFPRLPLAGASCREILLAEAVAMWHWLELPWNCDGVGSVNKWCFQHVWNQFNNRICFQKIDVVESLVWTINLKCDHKHSHVNTIYRFTGKGGQKIQSNFHQFDDASFS